MAINILIVDDSTVMRAIILKTMQMSGIQIGEIYQAANGQEGLETVKDNWIDIVIADINMPVMNGEEMIDRMQDNLYTRDIPVVVVSTEGSQKRIERLKDKGVTFISKPFTPELVRDTIKTVTGMVEDNE
ncbi:MAG: response regulator [Deltaproteobacteria bacterium]|nr:response regulator [Deltaproteobacteria bacterium]